MSTSLAERARYPPSGSPLRNPGCFSEPTPERLIEEGDVLSLPHPGGASRLLRDGRFPHSPQVRQNQPVAPTEPSQVAQVGGMAGGPTSQHDHRLSIDRADLIEPQLGPVSTSVKGHDATLCLFLKTRGGHTPQFSRNTRPRADNPRSMYSSKELDAPSCCQLKMADSIPFTSAATMNRASISS